MISLCGFYLAWRLWRTTRALTSAVIALTRWEQQVHRILDIERTPRLIKQGQQAVASLRQRRDRLEHQIRQLQRILAVIVTGVRLLSRESRQHRRFFRIWYGHRQ